MTKYYRNTVICYSFSKSLSLPGERIGYLVVPDEMDEAEQVFNAAVIANRVLGCVNAPSFMQRVIKRCIELRQMCRLRQEQKSALRGAEKLWF